MQQVSVRNAVWAIILLGLAAYVTSFSGAFIWDDAMLIKENQWLSDPVDSLRFFAADIGMGAGRRFGFYRPLQMVSYALDRQLWGLHPGGYHLLNVLLHIGVALCVMWLGGLLLREKGKGEREKEKQKVPDSVSFNLSPLTVHLHLIPFLAAALYVVHPVHTDAVSYISGRADSLAVLFSLIAVCIYITLEKGGQAPFFTRPKNGPGSLVFMGLSCALALFSREFAVVQPGLILAYHFAYRRPIWKKGFAVIAGLTAAYLLLRFTALKFIITGVYYPTTIVERLPGFFAAMTGYARVLFFPFDLHNEYGNRLFTFTDPRVIAGIILTAAMILYAFLRRKRDPLGAFACAWFFVGLAPVTNIYPAINAYMLEHWLYGPSIVLFIAVARCMPVEERRGKREKVHNPNGHMLFLLSSFVHRPSIVFIFIVLTFSFLTARQNLIYWQDPIQFYKRTLQFNPESKKMPYNIGNTYRERGMREPAIYWYRQALAVDPDNEDILNNLAGLYGEEGRYDEAIEALRRAIEINPRLVEAHYNLGITYKDAGRIPEAVAALQQAIQVQPAYAAPYSELGMIHKERGEDDEALRWFEKALQVDPAFAPAYLNAAAVYAARGDMRTAEAYAARARNLGVVTPERERTFDAAQR